MKLYHNLITFFLISLLVIPFHISAQEQQSMLIKIWDFAVQPSKVSDFEKILKEIVAKDKKYQLSHPYRVYKTGDFHYHLRIAVEGYGDFEKYGESWNSVRTKMGAEKNDLLYEKLAETYESYTSHFVRRRHDLSYIPENPRLKEEERNYVFIDRLFVKSSKEKEFEELMKELLALEKKKNISETIIAGKGASGQNLPFYNFALIAKNDIDFFGHNQKMWELLGEEGRDIFNNLFNYVRSREFFRLTFCPDLSYTVEK